MHGAPPVQMLSGPDRAWAWCVRGLFGLAAGTLAAWLAGHLSLNSWMGIALTVAAALSAAAVAGRGLLPTQEHRLNWDGKAWWFDGQPADLSLKADLNRWLLLRVRCDGRAHWLPLRLRGTDGYLFRAVLMAGHG
jgi:hypothetical protein